MCNQLRRTPTTWYWTCLEKSFRCEGVYYTSLPTSTYPPYIPPYSYLLAASASCTTHAGTRQLRFACLLTVVCLATLRRCGARTATHRQAGRLYRILCP